MLKNNKIVTSLQQFLANLNSYYELKLNLDKIGDAEAKELALVLKENQTLQLLDLQLNKIKETGARELALALKENQTLQSLDLRGNEIGRAGARELA